MNVRQQKIEFLFDMVTKLCGKFVNTKDYFEFS
jgi:hypothetical protein